MGIPHATLGLMDKFFDGYITAMRRQLELGVQVNTGDSSFVVFQDSDGIEFGVHWPSRLEEALSLAIILIPCYYAGVFYERGLS